MEYFDVLDEKGEKTGGLVERSEAHRLGIPHRSVQVWIMDSQNRLLLQKRSAAKDIGPNLWYASMGGHIARGETKGEAILRELWEELGLDASPYKEDIRYLFTFQETGFFKNGAVIDNEFCDVYLLRRDINLGDLVLQAEEVAAVKWVDLSAFKAMVARKEPSLWIHPEGYAMLFPFLENPNT